MTTLVLVSASGAAVVSLALHTAKSENDHTDLKLNGVCVGKLRGVV